MKRFKKLVGLLLCLAMVLSIVPISIVGAAELGAETEWVMQKIDLTDCIVSACSNNFNSSNSYRDQDWYTNDHSDWKDFNALVDGYYYNEVYFGCSHPERADLYIDLTEKYGGAVSLDQLKVYHGGFGAVPSLYVALVLEGGTKIEKSFTLGWEAGVEADPLTWTFGETYDIEGVYIWQNGNAVKAYFGEIELLSHKEVACEVVEIVNLDTPTFGYYADGDTNGAITEYYDTSYGPANLIDGDHDSYTRSLSYTYSEIQNEEKIPAILFDLGKEFSLAGVEINGYQYGYYNMCDFTIQVYDSTGTWTTVKTVKKAFDTSVGAAGEDTEPVMYRFDAIVGSKVRILVNGVNDMGDEDPDQKVSIDGFCVREIALYNGYGEAPGDESDADNTPSILDNLIVMESAPTPTVGYYTDNNTDGAITDYHNSTHTPANMVNGDVTDQSRSEYYTHAEIASGAKVPVILFDFESTTVLGGLDIYGYQTSRYNMEDFEVQVYTSAGWVTAASVTDAFYEEGSFGDTLSGPLTVAFDQLYTTTKLRILVSGISDMTADGAEDAQMLEGGYIRIREIEFYSEEAPGPYIETANLNGVDLSEYVIVYSADEPDYNLRAAQHIRSAIKKRTGRVLTIVEDDAAETDCEILVGDTNRSLSQTVTAPANNQMKFTIQTSGTKIAMEADYFIIAGAAYYFTETYIDDANFNVTVSDVTRAPITEKANNYIMLIGDGMGVNQTKLFEAYDVPTSGDFAYSDGEDIFYGYYLPYYGLVETCNSSGTTTDSAAAGTALATGYKTVNTWIGVDKSGNSVQNLTELALSLGMGAAVMSTEEITGATPAAFSSHVSTRSDSSGILADQAKLKAEGAIIYDEDYYPYYTAEEWASAEPAYIKTLNQVAENDSFFLMYEEAYIDKNGHYSNAPWCFRTMYRFNQAIGFFMEFAMYNPDTLVVITADHETGNMDSSFTFDGGGSHSSQDVPIFAYGVGASAFDTDSSYHNTSIARTFAYMMTGGDTSFGDSQWPILLADENEPDDPDPTTPTEPPADGTMQKIDLTDTVVGVDSQDSASKTDFTTFTWYTDANPTWKDITIPVNGNYDDEIHWGLDPHERGDIYLDLTRINAEGVAASQLKLYHSKYRDVPSLVVILKLADGSFVEKTFTLGWKQDVAADPFVYTFDETYTVTGVYLWENQSNENLRPTFGEIEMFYRVGDEPATPDAPTTPTEPTTPPATEPATPTTPPATEPAETMEKIDLTNSVVGCDSQDSATQSDYSKLTWYSTLNPGWKELSHFTDGDYSNEVHWGLDDWERADVYIDLTKNTGSAVAVDQFKLYHSTYRDVGSVYFALILADGTVVENTATLNWKQDVAADPYVFTYDQTYTAVGLYVWQPDNNPTNGIRAAFGEIELWKYEDSVPEGTDPTEPTEPTTPPATEPTTPPATEPVVGTGLKVVSPTKLSTVFGCYTDGTGADESTFSDGNDGYCVTDGWFGRAGYSERTSAQGKIALIMTLSETKTLGGIEITGNGTSYDPVDFDVQALVDGQWVTVYTQTSNAFTSSIRTVMFEFDQTVTTNKIRILVNEVSGGANSQCRLQEVVLFETAEKAFNNIDLTGKGSSTDANAANPIGNLVDNSKDSIFLGSNATFNLGTATKIDGFRLFGYRGNGTYPSDIQVRVKLTADGEYTSIGTFSTGFSTGYPWPIVDVEFDQTYEVYGIQFNFGAWSYINGMEIYQYVEAPAEPEQPDTILVGSSYNVHLIEPWALRVNVQFARNTASNLIPVSEFTSYGAYAIIGNKFDGTTAEELMADPDAVKYSNELENVTAGDTSFYFDFYDGLYSYNLSESVYWVAYFETADGTYYTEVIEKSLTDVANALLGKEDVSESEKAVLQSMKDMKDAVIELRGEDANLGNVYPAGVANTNGLGNRNTGYAFGASHQIKLIEPWGVRVRVLMRDKTAPGGVYADYASADDYGLIFFHDKTGKYGGTMTAAQMSAEADAQVYSKLNGNAEINANGVTAVYDQGIYTYDLDTELYCLPYIVIDGEYYYPSNVMSWNLLAEMVEFSENENLDPKETAVFDAMLEMYNNVQNHLG